MLYTVKTNGPRLCALNGCQIGNHLFHPDSERELDLSDDELAFLRGAFVGEDKQIASIEAVGGSGKAMAASPTLDAPSPAPAADPPRRGRSSE